MPNNDNQRFRHLIWLLTNNLSLATYFALCSSASECEFLSSALLKIAFSTKTTLQLIKNLIQAELKRYEQTPQNIFRGNSLTSKLLGVYVRKVGLDYLQNVLGSTLRQLIEDKDLSMEIDIDKLSGLPDPQTTLEQNRELLKLWCDKIINAIMDAELTAKMPLEIRIVASYIAEASEQLKLNTPVLIGGYIMLRFFNPAVVAPEVYELVPPGIKSSKGQRNLILISKIMQNLSNNVVFGSKEPYMVCMNEYIEERFERMNKYLLSLVDAQAAPLQVSDEVRVPTDVESLDLTQFDAKDLQRIQEIIYDQAEQVLLHLQNEAIARSEPVHAVVAQDYDFIRLLIDTPDRAEKKDSGQTSPLTTSSFSQLCDTTEKLVEKVLEASTENLIRIINTQLDWQQSPYREEDESIYQQLGKERFFYQGQPNKEDMPIFYLIARRLKMDYITKDLNKVIVFILRTIGNKLDSPFGLVLDMTWTYVPTMFKDTVQSGLEKVLARFNHSIQNLCELYIVQATAANLATTQSILKSIKILKQQPPSSTTGFSSSSNSGGSGTSGGVEGAPAGVSIGHHHHGKRKVREIPVWTQMMEFFEPTAISLPEESKLYISKSYKVVKVNSKGRQQDRIIKVTPKSILNIDPKNQLIKNERLLVEIEEILAPPSTLEITLRFYPESTREDQGYFPAEKSSNDDLLYRKYICASQEDRSDLLKSIFEAAVRFKPRDHDPPAFKVLKTNRKGKKQERIFKISMDSLMNVDKRTIKDDFPFLAFEFIREDPNPENQPGGIIFKLRDENRLRSIITEYPKEFLECVQEGITRCRQQVNQ